MTILPMLIPATADNPLVYLPERASLVLNHYQRVIHDQIAEDLFRKLPRRLRRYLYLATGGGKTAIINNIAFEFLRKKRRVLFVTHDMFLLDQTALDLCQRFGNRLGKASEIMGYIGAESDRRNSLIKKHLDSYTTREWDDDPHCLYVTWQSLYRAIQDKRSSSARSILGWKPDLIVIDEAHWGKSGRIEETVYGTLFDGVWDGVPIIGLSGTPKPRVGRGWAPDPYGGIGFSALVEQGILARPEPVRVTLTGTIDIEFDSTNRIRNYGAIGQDSARNLQIHKHYLQHPEYRKTLIFAVDIENANALGVLFRHEGAVVIHSHKSDAKSRLQDFRVGKYKVAIVVGMAKEGVDIPDIQTIFLCKPVTSQIEFAQMVGRGARKAPGKNFFFVVDFFDSLKNPRNEAHLYHFNDYYTGANDCEDAAEEAKCRRTSVAFNRPAPRARYRDRHEHEIGRGMETLVYSPNETPPSLLVLNGLRINPGQTFGIEFEMTSARKLDWTKVGVWQPVANSLLANLRSIFGDRVATRTYGPGSSESTLKYSEWNVVYDGTCGWEVVSPILMGREGFEEVAILLASWEREDLLARLGLTVDYRTGTHVHLGWQYNDPGKVQRIIQFVRRFEPALFSLIAPSRVGAGGSPAEFCESLRTQFSDRAVAALTNRTALRRAFSAYEKRYSAVNMTGYDNKASTLEIRSHNGTVDAQKLLTWTALWMNVISAVDAGRMPELAQFSCRKELTLPNDSEDSDIVRIAVLHLGLQEETKMLEKLHVRRRAVISGSHWHRELGQGRVRRLLEGWEEAFSNTVQSSKEKV